MEKKRLYRTEGSAAMLAGVCGGIAEYFDIDPTIVRIVWAAAALGTASAGLWLYVVCAVIVPKKSSIYPDL